MTEKVNCQNEADVLSCLMSKPWQDIISHVNDLGVGICWYAVYDSSYTDQPFLIGEPEQLLSSGQFNKVDVIIGTNLDEGIFSFFDKIANPALWEDYKNNFDIIGPAMLFGKTDITDLDVQRAHELLEFYVGGVDNIDVEHQQGMIDMMTDSIFLYGTHRTIFHLVTQGIDVFQYILTYQGQYSFTNVFGLPTIGVCHADDLIYLFNPLGTSPYINLCKV